MYRVYESIVDAVEKLNAKLDNRGKPVYNKRTGKNTKELIGVIFKAPIDFFMNYFKERPENAELETAFDEALRFIFKDETARYAFGTPQVNLNIDRPPCPIGVQIIIRDKPIAIVYFRSQNIDELPYDFAVVARKMFISFGEGEIIWIIGSLHKEVD